MPFWGVVKLSLVRQILIQIFCAQNLKLNLFFKGRYHFPKEHSDWILYLHFWCQTNPEYFFLVLGIKKKEIETAIPVLIIKDGFFIHCLYKLISRNIFQISL